MKFSKALPYIKDGDEVKLIKLECCKSMEGQIVTVRKYGGNNWDVKGNGHDLYIPGVRDEEIELINQKSMTETILESPIKFIKEQALKLKDNDEYLLRKAGIHNDCGELTSEGKELMNVYIEDLVHKKLVDTAREMVADEDGKKGKK